jgi:GntR family transcriptional repressor for pyruvate dehydrogenase complex
MSEDLLSPIRKKRISDQVAEQLEQLIRERKIKVGEPLPSERKLMSMLQVGRGAVREGLRILEIKGIVETRQGVGAFVKDFEGDMRLPLSVWLTDQNEIIANFFEVRMFIEPNAACLAAKRISEEKLQELEKTHEEFCKKIEKKDLPGAIILDAQFHKIIAQSTNNKLLAIMLETLTKSVIEGWKASLRVPGRIDITIVDHQNILDAIKAGDSEKAGELMANHLKGAMKDLRDKGLDI